MQKRPPSTSHAKSRGFPPANRPGNSPLRWQNAGQTTRETDRATHRATRRRFPPPVAAAQSCPRQSGGKLAAGSPRGPAAAAPPGRHTRSTHVSISRCNTSETASAARNTSETAWHLSANGTNARQNRPQNEHSVRAIKVNLLFAKHVDSQNARPAPPLPHRAHGRRVAYHPLPRPGTKAGPRPGTIGLEEKNHHVTMPIDCCDLAGNQPKRRLPFIARWLCKNDPR